MKVTKEQKVFIGLLTVGLIALGVDRFVLSPSSAEASDDSASLLVAKAPEAKATPSSNNKAPTPAAATASTNNPVAQKLVALSDALHLADVPVKDTFATPAAWIERPGTVAGGKPFDQMHSLSGVMVSGRHPAAMVDGKLVSVGQLVDGYKLVAVGQGVAVFQMGDNSVTLRSR